MEPKVSINDLKKIRSFSRQRNMVCVVFLRTELFLMIDFLIRMFLKHWLVLLLHQFTVMNILSEQSFACY